MEESCDAGQNSHRVVVPEEEEESAFRAFLTLVNSFESDWWRCGLIHISHTLKTQYLLCILIPEKRSSYFLSYPHLEHFYPK